MQTLAVLSIAYSADPSGPVRDRNEGLPVPCDLDSNFPGIHVSNTAIG